MDLCNPNSMRDVFCSYRHIILDIKLHGNRNDGTNLESKYSVCSSFNNCSRLWLYCWRIHFSIIWWIQFQLSTFHMSNLCNNWIFMFGCGTICGQFLGFCCFHLGTIIFWRSLSSTTYGNSFRLCLT